MPPRPSTATRLALLCCALASATALTLGACGSDGAATADDTATGASGERPAKPRAAGQPCPAKVSAFVDALDRLRRQLAIGLSYEQYAARVQALQHDYDAVPIDHLGLACLTTTATPAERALNRYIDAANAWGECLADAACATATIEPVLQRKWRVASNFLGKAG